MEQRAVGLRDRKKQRTRTQLIDAALRLFTENGFDGTTIEDIVGEVEVSPRTFFRYFSSKEDVVIGFFDEIGDELCAMLAARPAQEPPFTAVRGALRSLIDRYTAEADRVLAAKRLASETPAIRARLLDKHARWENGVAAELAARLAVDPDRHPDPRLIAALTLAAFSTAVARWVASDGKENLAELVDQSLEKVATGLEPT